MKIIKDNKVLKTNVPLLWLWFIYDLNIVWEYTFIEIHFILCKIKLIYKYRLSNIMPVFYLSWYSSEL